jgi:hypothetical protein
MKRIRIIFQTVMLSGIAIPGVLFGEDTLFSDDFSSPAVSNMQWAIVADGSEQLVFTQGTALLENGSTAYAAFALHSFRQAPVTFTFSADLICPYPGTGLFLCTNNRSGEFEGLSVIVGAEEILLYEYQENIQVLLELHDSRFLQPDKNTLTVSTDGNELRVFCNGFYQFRTQVSPGKVYDMGILAPPQSSMSFDNVYATAGFVDTVRFVDFSDDLTTATEQSAWRYSIHGGSVWERGENGLEVTSGSAQPWYAWLPISVEEFYISVVVDEHLIDSTDRFGIALNRSRKNEVNIPYLHFSISDSAASIEWFSEDGDKIREHRQPLSGVMNGSTGDTLALLKTGREYTLIINSDTVGVLEDEDVRFGSVGVFATGTGEANFHDFILRDEGREPETGTLVRFRSGNQCKQFYLFDDENVFDLLGREVVVSTVSGTKKIPRLTVTASGIKRLSGIGK